MEILSSVAGRIHRSQEMPICELESAQKIAEFQGLLELMNKLSVSRVF